MVDGFARCPGDFREWNELFDRVLCLPLRRLKEWSSMKYHFEKLCSPEYFHQRTLKYAQFSLKSCSVLSMGEGSRTPFILDGLDEITQESSINRRK